MARRAGSKRGGGPRRRRPGYDSRASHLHPEERLRQGLKTRKREASTAVLSAMRVACVLFPFIVVAREARATDPFEIQVYDGTANKPGVFGLELHANAVVRGLRDPSLNAAPEAPQDRQVHFTFEPSIGVTPWWELGGYFQTAI